MMMILLQFVAMAFTVYTFMIFGRLIGSWFPNFAHTPIMQFLARCTDPYLNLFRRFIPPLGMLDLSPIVAMMALYVVRAMLLSFLASFLG